MTHDEMENALKKLADSLQELRDAQLVQVRLMDRYQGEWKGQMSELLAVVAGHEQRLVGVEDRMARQEESMSRLGAAMGGLFERMDRFIQGLERENGKKE